jgi:hypothetical protein
MRRLPSCSSPPCWRPARRPRPRTPRATGETAAATAASPKDYLLDSAAGDFRTHPPAPLGFRNVRYGQLDDNGVVSHRLCGEFRVTRSGGTRSG